MNQKINRETELSLKVGGFTPLTTIDYPNELAAAVFCQGCPWRCHYCHNSGLLKRNIKTDFKWSEILNILKNRSKLLDAVVFSGGEPTLQPGLTKAISDVKLLNLKVGLHTAGCYPEKLKNLIPAVDWIGLDIKGNEDDYDIITGIKNSGSKAWQSLQLLQQANIDYEVRITVHEGLLPNHKLLSLLQFLADIKIPKLALQQCRSSNMLNPDCGPPGTSWQDSPALTFAMHNFPMLTLRNQ